MSRDVDDDLLPSLFEKREDKASLIYGTTGWHWKKARLEIRHLTSLDSYPSFSQSSQLERRIIVDGKYYPDGYSINGNPFGTPAYEPPPTYSPRRTSTPPKPATPSRGGLMASVGKKVIDRVLKLPKSESREELRSWEAPPTFNASLSAPLISS